MRITAAALAFILLPAALYASQKGAPVSEPELMRRTDIIFFEDFESKNWGGHWRNSNRSGYDRTEAPLSFVVAKLMNRPEGLTSNVFFGFGALECEQHTGTHDPSEMTVRMPDQDCAFIRWYRKYEDGYDWTTHKMPGFYAYAGGRKTSRAGVRPTGADKFGAKLAVVNRAIIIYCYHPDQRGGYGDNFRQNVGPTIHLETGKWYCLELMVKANNPPERDGELKMWINGELKTHKTGMRLRDTPDLKINTIIHSAYVGGTWTSKRDQRLWDDNFVVAQNYIGPIKIVRKVEKKKPVRKFLTRKPPLPKGPPDDVKKALDEARKTALSGDFTAAAATLEEASKSLKEEHRPLLKDARKTYLSVQAMKQWVIDGAKDGREEKVLVDLMGTPTRVKVRSADESGIGVAFAGSSIPLGWDKLSARRLVGIFSRYRPDGDAPEEQLEALRKALGLKK